VSVIVIGNIGVGLFISQIEDYDEKVEISGYFIYPKERGGKEGGREREREKTEVFLVLCIRFVYINRNIKHLLDPIMHLLDPN
jgi:hypothetical protein